MESELEPCPLGFEENILHVVVNDESSDTIGSGIVSRDGCGWSEGKSLSIIGIISK